MKQLVNTRIATLAVLVAFAAAMAPVDAHGQTGVSANWVQTATQGPSARGGAAMANDATRQRTVLFGGSDGSGSYFSDTWQYDGASWTRLQVSGPTARSLALMAFDSARKVTVLYGGYNNGVINDTWEWDGSTWTQRLTAHTPPARLWSAMTYDSARHVVVLFGGELDTLLDDTWRYDGTDWTQVTTAHSPPARRGHGIAYDSARAVTVLFGGQASANLNDTWEFNGADWTQVVTAGSPVERIWPAMGYDPNLGGTVMFGGAFGSNYTALGDTWLYDGSTWQQIAPQPNLNARFYVASAYESNRGDFVMFGGSLVAGGGSNFGDTWSLQGVTTSALDWVQAAPAISPPPRVDAAMDYDSARGVSVLFGGSNASPRNLQDTWEWNGSSWVQRSPVTSPPALAAASMAYDSVRGVSVLFGGAGDSVSSATWEWDGTNWIQRSFAVSPPAEVWGGMAYDSSRNRVVLLEGDPNSGFPAQTWEYDGTVWTQLHPANSPSARRGPAMAYDARLARTVLFGGAASTGRQADTWEWDGTNWTQIPTAAAPSPRLWASLAFDSQRGKTVLFGGDNILPYVLGETNDSWEFDGTNWTLDPTAAAPARRAGQAGSYDSARGRMVVFGGWNPATSPATFYGDTWELGTGIPTPSGTSAGDLLQNGTLNFGNVFVGQTSQATQTYAVFMLVNTGTGPLTVNSITVTGGDFPMTNYCPAGGNPLAAGSFCTTLVAFTPTAAGPRTGSITFDYSASGGNQTFQLQGAGVLNPTTLTAFAASAPFKGTTTVVASLASNGSALAGQPVMFALATGATATIQTNSSGYAIWSGASMSGVHAGSYPAGIQVSFAGTQAYAASSASAQLTIVQPVTTTYMGEFYVADTAASHVTIRVDQRTPASDPQFIDYAKTVVWARFIVVGPASSTTIYAQVTDAPNWSTTGLGAATAALPALADGAYTIAAALVDGPSFVPPSSLVASDDSRTGLVSSPIKGPYLSGGGAIATDPSGNTSDRHGYFSLQMKQGKPPVGNLVYSYRVSMDVGGGSLRDVDVWVTSTDVTSLSGESAAGHFNVEYVDAQTGQRYSGFEFTGGTFKLTVMDATKSSPARLGLVLKRPDGTVFHTTGSTLVPVVLGKLVSNL
ncbi:MAG TPA: kelch repeat-containing protein [Candidatus Limnocylindrales bacterium]|nr:kelch repeat-containing protein [Candidatus Limnocylindrales bacterium]